jgi:hypothetical protein
MKKTRSFQLMFANFLCAPLSMAFFTHCTNDVEIEKPQPAAAQTESTATSEEDAPVLSLTIDGIHTILSSTADCKTCDYVVPEDATVVDGKALGIKPGQAICLDEAFKYGNLRLINLEGEEKKPIIVAYGVKNTSLALN